MCVCVEEKHMCNKRVKGPVMSSWRLETVSASVVFARREQLKKVASSMCGILNDVCCLLPASQSAGG